MRVVVTGATGNVGTALIQALADESEVTEIVGIARRPPGTTAPKTTFVAADIAGDDLRAHVAGADAVVHLAWLFQPTHDPFKTWHVNVEGSIRVFDAVAEARVPVLVYASSVGAYSPGRGEYVDESWPTNSIPTAAYGREKAYVERVLDAFEARHPEIRVVRLRPAFIFRREAASQQRRLFAGPLLPGVLVRPGRLPAVPYPQGLRFQALHSRDAGDAYRRALLGDVRGAFNVAAEPVIDGERLAAALGGRRVALPSAVVRAGLAAAWRMHAVPADPALLDLVLQLPLMDTTRARTVLGWEPRHSAVDAVCEMLEGMAEGAGTDTEPLARDTPSRRVEEFVTGVGERDTVD